MKDLTKEREDHLLAIQLIDQMTECEHNYKVAAKMLNHVFVPELKDYHQKMGDDAIGERMRLQVIYSGVIKRIAASFVPAEQQLDNAREITNMEAAERFFQYENLLN